MNNKITAALLAMLLCAACATADSPRRAHPKRAHKIPIQSANYNKNCDCKTKNAPVTRVLAQKYTGVAGAQDITIRTREEWCAFWAEVHASVDPKPPCAASEIDFSREIVVAAPLGERRNGCHNIEITGAEIAMDGPLVGALLVSVEERKDEASCPCTMAIVHPVVAVRVALPKSKGVPQPFPKVIFYRTQATVPCRQGALVH